MRTNTTNDLDADADRATAGSTLAQRLSSAVGAVFLLVGILGFVPGVTTNYGDMTFAGHDSGARLLGIFQVSVLHNMVHLLFGVLGLSAARAGRAARGFLLYGGIVYVALWAYGVVIDHDTAANFVPFNTADDWLHLGLGVSMVGLGALASAARPTAVRESSPRSWTQDAA